MITPDQFYSEQERPTAAAKQRMWANVKKQMRKRKSGRRFIADRSSFFYGMAAAIILYFSGVGILATVRQSMQSAQPEAVRLDAAYQAAIEQFEKVVPQMVSSSVTPGKDAGVQSVRQEQLKMLDGAIAEMRTENTGRDISPQLQKRLRQLYSLKLKVLQEMVEQGEIEL